MGGRAGVGYQAAAACPATRSRVAARQPRGWAGGGGGPEGIEPGQHLGGGGGDVGEPLAPHKLEHPAAVERHGAVGVLGTLARHAAPHPQPTLNSLSHTRARARRRIRLDTSERCGENADKIRRLKTRRGQDARKRRVAAAAELRVHGRRGGGIRDAHLSTPAVTPKRWPGAEAPAPSVEPRARGEQRRLAIRTESTRTDTD